MASFFPARLSSRRCMAAAAAAAISSTSTSTSSPFRSLHHALSSLRHLHSSSPSASHASNPNPSSLPTTLYPSFPHSAHLGPVSLSEASDGGLIRVQLAPLTPAIHAIVRLEFVKESGFGVSAAGFGNVGLVPLSEVLGLEIETDDGDEDEEGIVIRADSVKKKRKRKMNKHKLRKLRKKLRRKT